jgi:hypothetical protein
MDLFSFLEVKDVDYSLRDGKEIKIELYNLEEAECSKNLKE